MWLGKFTLLFLFTCFNLSYENTFTKNRKDLLLGKCDRYPVSCPVYIAHSNESGDCRVRRDGSVMRNRQYYKLTRYKEKHTIRFPLRSVPFLNQTIETVKFFTITNPLEARWLGIAQTFLNWVAKLKEELGHQFANVDFSRSSDYVKIYEAHQQQILSVRAPHIFGNPNLFPSFTDVIYNGRYMSDDVFVQGRLAGPCPFLIKLVTAHGNTGFSWREIKGKLNTEHDFRRDLRNAINEKDITIDGAVEEGRLYALYHEELNEIHTVNDYYNNEFPLMNISSPITLFARTLCGELKVVAIQIDDKTTSPVYSPKSDDLKWAVAKAAVNLADQTLCQGMWHLGYIHFATVPFCAIFRSHLSDIHPIYQIMQYHCEGTTPHLSLLYTTIFGKDTRTRKIQAVGNTGFIKLAAMGSKKFKYGTLAFDNILKSHGLDSKELKYYPFRDDGKVIWSRLKSFADDFTNLYYDTDADVINDYELQSFTKQLSADCGPGDLYGGKGNIAGLPCFLATKEEVATFITRFIWRSVMHDAANYPAEPWNTFIPLGPTKMYADVPDGANKRNHTIFNLLPDKLTTLTMYQSVVAYGNLRVNRMFDYHDKIQDKDLRKLIKRYHFHFATCIQELLEKRNEDRKKNKQMGFQYFEPKWLTNSMHV